MFEFIYKWKNVNDTKPKMWKWSKITRRTSSEAHLHWKDHFRKNLLYFRITADFEADNEIEDSKAVGNKTNITCNQKLVCNGYYIVSELKDVLQSGHSKSPLGYENVDWFFTEHIKIEIKMIFYFKNTRKHIIMTRKMKKILKIKLVDFMKKILTLIKLEITVT